MYSFFIALFCMLLIMSGGSWAKADNKSAQCKSLTDKIERYTRLRRAGGSARQMDRWHRARNKAKQQYRDRGC